MSGRGRRARRDEDDGGCNFDLSSRSIARWIEWFIADGQDIFSGMIFLNEYSIVFIFKRSKWLCYFSFIMNMNVN